SDEQHANHAPPVKCLRTAGRNDPKLVEGASPSDLARARESRRHYTSPPRSATRGATSAVTAVPYNARSAVRRLLMHLDDAAAGKRSEGRDSTQNRPIGAICRMYEASKGGKRLRHVDERQREAAARHRSEPR